MAEAYFGSHGDEPMILATPEDVDRMIDELVASDWDDTVAALYLRERPLNAAGVPDHEMLVAVNQEDKVGGLAYNGHQGEPGTLFSKGATAGLETVNYFYFGNEREFPGNSEVPLDVVRAAVKEFLSTGLRPVAVEWQLRAADA